MPRAIIWVGRTNDDTKVGSLVYMSTGDIFIRNYAVLILSYLSYPVPMCNHMFCYVLNDVFDTLHQ